MRDYLLKKIAEKCQTIDECWELARKYPNDTKVKETFIFECGKNEAFNEVLTHLEMEEEDK